jgi:hypothetical protein
VPGYRHPESILASYPGYPLVIDTIAWVPGIGLKRAGFAVTIAAGLAAAWGLTRLGMALTGDRRLSLVMVAVWAVAPASFVLSMVYSEALFCALAIWSLVALVERRWLMAGVLTIGAGLARSSTAVALVAAVTVAALPTVIAALRARQPAAMWWRPAVALLLSPLGALGYWAYSAVRLRHLGGFIWTSSALVTVVARHAKLASAASRSGRSTGLVTSDQTGREAARRIKSPGALAEQHDEWT